MAAPRRFVIGDIHGCAKALRSLIQAISPGPDDELIFLGDYVDRGPNTRDAVQQIIDLQRVCRVIGLRGNHEIMLLGVVVHGLDGTAWLRNGGQATVASYGGSLLKIPQSHLDFFQRLEPYHETDESIFVHAGYDHDLPMREQGDDKTYWTHLSNPPPPPHQSGKRVYVGHTPQPTGSILDHGHLICIDTFCFGGGFLTALELGSHDIIQADRHGHLRRSPLSAVVDKMGQLRRLIGQSVRSPFAG